MGKGFWLSGDRDKFSLYRPGEITELGSAFSIFPFIDFPLTRYKNFSVNFRFRTGRCVYLTKRFDRLTNYKDLAIGSHINASANMMFKSEYKLSERLNISLGFGLQHFSNGSLKLPNYGIEYSCSKCRGCIPSCKGKQINRRPISSLQPSHYSAILRHNIEFDIGVSLGWKNMKAVIGQNFLVYHLYENTFFPVKTEKQVGIWVGSSV